MMKRFFRVDAFFVFALSLLLSFSAFAKAAIDQEGAKRLQSVFETMIASYEDAAKSNGATLVSQGKVMVEVGDAYYAVTLPDLSVRQPDGSHTDIGMISINALPGEKQGQWKMTMALPMPIIHYDGESRPVVTIKTGGQNFGGLWDESIRSFIKIDSRYKNINIRQHKDMVTVTLPDTRFTTDMKQGDDGLWSGPGLITISGLNMASERNGAAMRIGEVNMRSSVMDYSFQAMLDYQEKLAALAENYEESADEVNMSGSHVVALYNLVSDFMQKAWSGYDFSLSMNDFLLKVPARNGVPARQLNLGNGQFGFGMDGFRTGSVGMGFVFGYGGLQFAPANGAYASMMPDHMNFDLRIDKLPYREIAELGRTSVQGLVNAPQAGALIGVNAAMLLPQLLTKAQTTMVLKDTAIGNQKYDISSHAAMTANLNAAMGMTGTAKTDIYGLDYLIEGLSAIAADPDTPEEKMPGLQKAVTSLMVLKMAGQMGKDGKGRDIRSYVFELNEQGQAMLNGTDMKTLMQSVQGAKK